MHSPFDPRDLKAVVFDIDGTLYRQGPLRRDMLRRLIAANAVRPLAAWRTFAVLRAYRQAQEQLRGDASGDVAAAQLRRACEVTRLENGFVAACVQQWMEREPLAILHRHVQPGLIGFLDLCRARGLRLATLSDYPGDDKLRALGVERYFDVTLCAQAPDIGVFKPNPKGLRVALDRLGVAPREALYVGDRLDVDAAAAEAAGIPYAILTRSGGPGAGPGRVPAADYLQLRDLLLGPESSRQSA